MWSKRKRRFSILLIVMICNHFNKLVLHFSEKLRIWSVAKILACAQKRFLAGWIITTFFVEHCGSACVDCAVCKKHWVCAEKNKFTSSASFALIESCSACWKVTFFILSLGILKIVKRTEKVKFECHQALTGTIGQRRQVTLLEHTHYNSPSIS